MNIKYFRRSFTSIFFLFLLSKGFAQGGDPKNLEEIAASLVKSINDNHHELVYVHFDKPYYFTGTTIWFRSYLIQNQTKFPGNKTKVVYVDLVNEKDSVIDFVIQNAEEFGMDGGISLPTSLPEGNYRLRAYTPELLKNYPEGVFIYPLFIMNGQGKKGDIPVSPSIRAQGKSGRLIEFFPEGGSVISGIENTIAFIAYDEMGNIMPVAGTIRDERDSVVTTFRSSGKNPGKFNLSPNSFKRKYKAFVQWNDKAAETFPLPPMSSRAFQISLMEQTSSDLKFRVGLGDSVYSKSTISYLLGLSHGRIYFASTGNGMYIVNVPKKDLPAGPATFYLFDAKKNLVSLRNVYVEKKDPIVTITTNKKNYIRRERVRVDIEVKDSSGKPVSAVLSMAVTDDRYIRWPGDYLPIDAFIMSQQGNYRTARLFSKASQSSPELRDLAMMSNETLGEQISVPAFKLPSDTGIPVQGKVFSNNKPAGNQIVTLFSNLNHQIVHTDTTDENGMFRFDNLNFYDSTLFGLQVSNLKGTIQEMDIVVDPLPVPDPGISWVFNQADTSLLTSVNYFQQHGADSFISGRTKELLQEVIVRSSKRSKSTNASRNSFSHVITREKLSKMSLSTTADAVKMLPGVIMMNGRLTIRGGMPTLDPGIAGQLEPVVIVDGVQASTGGSVENYLNSISPDIIESIEVMTGPEAAIYGSRGASGVIVIKTGLPSSTTGLSTKKMFTFYPKGFHVSPTFYVPSYELDEVREAEFVDNRATIYWNGEVIPNNEGKASVTFFTADQPANYTITVQGITSRGDLIYQVYSIRRGQ